MEEVNKYTRTHVHKYTRTHVHKEISNAYNLALET